MATFISLRSPMPSGFYGCLSLSLMIKKKNAAILIDNILQYKIAFSRARASRSSNTVYLRDKSNLMILQVVATLFGPLWCSKLDISRYRYLKHSLYTIMYIDTMSSRPSLRPNIVKCTTWQHQILNIINSLLINQYKCLYLNNLVINIRIVIAYN